ncbi:hypothetical protein [Arthrobacter sp. UYEF3]|uniref:hypothetical protein n=1 Tax=Arthrobacter sp. UYEF3 TaxID=1756365 RepID=UPI003398B2C3
MARGRNSLGTLCVGVVVAALMSTASLAACGQQTGAQPPAAQPSMKLLPQPGISTITPEFTELRLDQTSQPAETVPWHLIRTDLKENRVYLSASSVGCTTPQKVRLWKSASEIRISVTGPRIGEPCTMQNITLAGYVQIDSIGERQVTGNSS